MTVNTTLRATGPKVSRKLRALRLYEERGDEIVRTAPFMYNVPSCTGKDFYVVRYDKETCECPDATRHPELTCKHVYAVGILRSKRRPGQEPRREPLGRMPCTRDTAAAIYQGCPDDADEHTPAPGEIPGASLWGYSA